MASSSVADVPSSTSGASEKPDSVIGPGLPGDLPKDGDCEDSSYEGLVTSASSQEDLAYGPALPPGFKPSQVQERSAIIGPALPPGLCKETLGGSDSSSSSDESAGVIGPLPPSGQSCGTDNVSNDFERRASKMKQKLTSHTDREPKREEWMTVLPPELGKNFGLGPRSFRRQTPNSSGDRSAWTDTPSQKVEKEQHGAEECCVTDELLEDAALERYDKEMSQRVDTYNKAGKRERSLLEIHQKNLKKKRKEEKDKVVERRPFDRDVDLKLNLMDAAKRDALVKRSMQLNDKFSHGKGQFL